MYVYVRMYCIYVYHRIENGYNLENNIIHGILILLQHFLFIQVHRTI
jgi:hypothetical protein